MAADDEFLTEEFLKAKQDDPLIRLNLLFISRKQNRQEFSCRLFYW